MNTSKGQYFSFDAIVATVIFILTVVTLLSYWHSVRTSMEFQTNTDIMEAIRISDLFFSPGSPADASCGSQYQLGFAVSWNDKRINKTKFLSCASLSDEDLRNKFFSRSNIVINMEDDSKTSEYVYIGKDLSSMDLSTIGTISKFRRIATVVNESGGNELAYLDFYVYK